MISEMVVMVANADIECHTAVQFFQHFVGVSHTSRTDEDVNNVHISMSVGCVISIFEVGQSQGRGKMSAAPLIGAVETTR